MSQTTRPAHAIATKPVSDEFDRAVQEPTQTSKGPQNGRQPEDDDCNERSLATAQRGRRPAMDTDSSSEESRLELRRRRRRVNMQRYRNKIQHRGDILDQEAQQLREEIQQLELQREAILARAPKSTVWSVTAEYFRLFQYGLKASAPARDRLSTTSELPPCDSSAQRDFLYRTMAPDVIGQTGSGVENLLREYQIIARCLPTISTRLDRLDYEDSNSLVATTMVEVVITSSSLRVAFPHLVPNGKWSTLATKLLDRHFFVKGSTRFEWNSSTRRFTLLQYNIDLLTPMLNLLGSFESVARVFEEAAITPEGTVARAAN
ncbi:hypothetical protein ON010_g1040 [Phytophthora cinnamomi]|nr:hypothetical protein ON010_g1040 [Phytophthora cinnamomi]